MMKILLTLFVIGLSITSILGVMAITPVPTSTTPINSVDSTGIFADVNPSSSFVLLNYTNDQNFNTHNLININDVNTQSLTLNTTAIQPTCDSSTRGRLWFTQNGLGVADSLQVCIKTALNLYSWVVVV